MSLTLVTGPANSAKAQLVLERYRAAAARGAILVVPRLADVEHYRRELAADGAVLGVRVEPFSGLLAEIATRAGVTGAPIGDHGRERILAAVIARTSLQALDGVASAPGFLPALARFVGELASRRVTAGRFTAALRAWATHGSRRARYAEELAALYGGYERALERLGRVDAELRAVRSLDALRRAPQRWGRTAVFCYGFDDFEPIQLDAVETLAVNVGAAVTVSLPGEPGRVALAGRAATLETLRPLAQEVAEQGPVDTHYEDSTLHHLERSLFEDAPQRHSPGRAVALLEGGDERAEAELIARQIAELVGGGCAPGDIAVVTRGGADVGPLVASALDALAVPHTAARREAFADTALGGGLLALLRAALLDGDAADLVRWLRVPGVVSAEAFIDRLESDLLVEGVRALEPARQRWEAAHWPLDALDRLAHAAGRPGTALLERVERELEGLFAAPLRRTASLVDPWPAAVLAAGRRALRELRELTYADRSLAPAPEAITDALQRVTVELATIAEADAVLICDALALRARRVRALFIAGMQEGSFPAAPVEPAFLSSTERSDLAAASGLILGNPLDQLAAERYLFYALCSRPTRWLRVSWHDATDDGEPALRSLFVDDLADCFDERLTADRVVRGAGAVAWGAGWPPATAPTLARREAALRGPRHRGPVLQPLAQPAALTALRGREAQSPSALERWLACPVSWFVERALRPLRIAPDELPLARGSVTHEALAAVFVALRRRAGSARIDEASLPLALELLDEVLADGIGEISRQAPVQRAEALRLRGDLRRYLRFTAASPSRHEPREFELAFGLPDTELPAVALAGGALELCGRIDRIDVDDWAATAIVYDYKASSAEPAARWIVAGRLQQALYMLAVEQLLGVRAAGGLYQPLRTADLRPRGAVAEDAEPAAALVDNDRMPDADLRALLEHQLAVAVAAAGEVRDGTLVPRPASCSREGSCRFPGICRAQAR